jgi:hypothetical protein
MMPTAERSKRAVYFFLFGLQVFGAIIFILQELPEFRQVVLAPGKQLPEDIRYELVMVAVFSGMQIAFWLRLLRVRIPAQRPSPLLCHLFLFPGRLSFIFGSALFSVVVFLHLPELDGEADVLLAAQRGIIFVACLFALFCSSLEVERLGHAFDSKPN